MVAPKLKIADEAGSKPTRRFPFTRARLLAERLPASGRVYVWDTRTTGLACCLTVAGTRTYYHVRKVRAKDGKGRRPVVRTMIDRVDAITYEAAKEKAEELNGTVAARKNPIEVRKEKERKDNAEKFFDHVFADYIADARIRGKRTVDEMERKGEIYLGEFTDRKINSITSAEAKDLHRRISKGIEFEGRKYGGKGAANRTIELLSAVFNFAGRNKDNPCDEVTRFSETERVRYLTTDELPAFFKALEVENPTVRDFFELALWTGQRRANVQSMRWDEISFTDKTWTIPASKFKTGKQLVVHLSPQALAILKERSKANAKQSPPSEYVLPSHRGLGKGKHPHLTEPKAAWKRILKRAELADLRIHDLRHTFASWQKKSGVDLATIGKSLGHSQVQTTARYAHIEPDQVRQSVDAGTAAMEKASKPKKGKGKK